MAVLATWRMFATSFGYSRAVCGEFWLHFWSCLRLVLATCGSFATRFVHFRTVLATLEPFMARFGYLILIRDPMRPLDIGSR